MLLALVFISLCFMMSPGQSFAGIGGSDVPTVPSPVVVGQTGVPFAFTIINGSTTPNDVNNVKVFTFFFTTACGSTVNPTIPCPAGQTETNVIVISPLTATGQAGTACAGKTFTVAATGNPSEYQFTPNSDVILGPSNPGGVLASCKVNFTVNIVNLPTHDSSNGAANGLQTSQLARTVNNINAGMQDIVTEEFGGAQGSSTLRVKTPEFTVNKTGPALSKIGDSVTYNYSITNTGEVVLNLVSVSDDKAGNLTAAANAAGCDVLSLSETCNFTANYTVQSGDPDPLVNTVTVTYNVPQTSINKTHTDTHSVNLFQPAIDVTKTCDAVSKVGDTVNYTITLSHNSSADTPALNCTAVDSLLGNVFGPAVLPLGNTVVNRQRVVQPGDPDPLVNTVTLTCSPQGFPNVLEASDECQTNLVQPSCSISKTCSPNPLVVGKPITWEITLNNTGGIALNICIEDTVAQISTCELVQPLGSTTLTSSRTVTAEDCPSELGASANITNTATATATVVGLGNQISCGQDTATCTCPQTELFGCRMTGGHPRFNPNGECVTNPSLLADVKKIKSVRTRRGFTVKEKIWYSVGGQIGAPDAKCCDTPPGSPGRDEECPSGSWEHVHHQGRVSWDSSIFSGGFAFHSGTASAPVDAYIRSIICTDKGWCVQARCAPTKQIFWDGTGVFHNIDSYTHFPDCRPIPKSNTKGATPTIHYYRAHVGDFGEPAGCTDNQKPQNPCPWRSNGVGVVSEDGCSLDGSPVVIPWPLDENFGDKGGQDCSGVCVNNRCGECPDWYEIEIHCTDDPDSPIIYKVGDFITHGNHQIHPEVGSNCFDSFPKP